MQKERPSQLVSLLYSVETPRLTSGATTAIYG
jgi:hypothetical protein